MEPSEAAKLPVPAPEPLARAWGTIEKRRGHLDELLRAGQWQAVAEEVDDAVLIRAAGVRREDVVALRSEAARLRQRRTRKAE